MRLSWQTTEAGSGDFASVLNAEGAIRVAIDGRSVRTNARLTVQSYGGGFDRFQVKLPRGAQLVQNRSLQEPSEQPNYRVSLTPKPGETAQSNAADRQQIVLIELPEKQRGPVTVELATEQAIGMEGESSVELGGMEVVGAVRQFGDVALQVAPDWQAHWDIGPHVRQVDPTEVTPLLQQPAATAAFQYDREPWSIIVRVAARKFRIVATPEYQLNFSADDIRLAVRLNYQVLGAQDL